MKSSKNPVGVYFVCSKDGQIWENTVSFDANDAKRKFVKTATIFPLTYIDSFFANEFWKIAEKEGYTMRTLFFEKED